jgi:hypothetical protein
MEAIVGGAGRAGVLMHLHKWNHSSFFDIITRRQQEGDFTQ